MKRKGVAILSFTERGRALAERLAAALDADCACARDGVSLEAWTAEQFPAREALLFVGAAGIAVRAVAPHVKSKAEDPAVVSVDERAQYAVALLSGHLGGANDLARRVAALCGAVPVISTATDLNGVFAADAWARRQDLRLIGTEKIKALSAKLLHGERIGVFSAYPVAGELPEGLVWTAREEAELAVDVRPHPGLLLVPQCLYLGIGCRRGVPAEDLEARFAAFCEEAGVLPQAICGAASVAQKEDEQGLLAFCAAHGWEPAFYTAEELNALPGAFSASDFVARTVGVDNVCERSAARLAEGGLICRKWAREGVTFALAERKPVLDWRWQDA